MRTITAALGQTALADVSRLEALLPDTIILTDDPHPNSDPLIAGLASKCDFARGIPMGYTGEVVWLDSDVIPLIDNPLDQLELPDGTDVAFVPYEGLYSVPDHQIDTFAHFGRRKLNSGVLWFRTAEIAADISSKWLARYLSTVGSVYKREKDEPALMDVLAESGYNYAFLDSKWNLWHAEPKDDTILLHSRTEDWRQMLRFDFPTPATDEDKQAKLAEIKAAREVAEHGGAVVEPFGLLPTDAETQSKITAVYVKALNDPAYTKNWKVSDTTWATLDAATIISIGDAIEDHVQAQFDKEQTLTEATLASTTQAELNAINW